MGKAIQCFSTQDYSTFCNKENSRVRIKIKPTSYDNKCKRNKFPYQKYVKSIKCCLQAKIY